METEVKFWRGIKKYCECLCTRFLGVYDEDVVAEALLQAVRRRKELPAVPSVSLKTWLFPVVKNLCRMQIRQEMIRKRLGYTELTMDILDIPEISVRGISENTIAVRQALAKLTPEEKSLAEDKLYGYTNKESAERRGKSLAQVNREWQAIRQKLRGFLEAKEKTICSQ